MQAHNTESELIIQGKHVLLGIEPSGQASIMDNAALHIRQGTIVEIGARHDLLARHPSLPVYGGDNRFVIPGLINAHHHTGLTPLQHGTPFLPLERWLPHFIGWRSICPYLDTLYSAIEMIESGITTVQHIHGGPSGPQEHWMNAPSEIMRAYHKIGMRASFSFMWRDQNRLVYGPDNMFLNTLPPALRSALAEWLGRTPLSVNALTEHFRQCHDQWHNAATGTTAVQLAPANLQWCSEQSLLAQRDLAKETGVPMHMHLLETVYQRAYAQSQYGCSAIQHLDQLDMLGPEMTLGHGIWMTQADIELLAQRGGCLCHNPSSGLRLQSGIAPITEALNAGITVTLGIDQSGLNDDRDLFQEMRLAWALQRTPGLDHQPPEAGIIFRMATEGAAATTPFSGRIGKLEQGMAADVALLDWDSLKGPWLDDDTPLFDVVFHRTKPGMVTDVFVDGKAVMQAGKVCFVDKDAVLQMITESMDRPLTTDEQARRSMAKALDPHVRAFYQDWSTLGPHTSTRNFNASL